jgi:hypothetical protein
VPSNEPYAWLTNTNELRHSSSPLNDEFLIVLTRSDKPDGNSKNGRAVLLFFDISNGIKPGHLMQHLCGYGIGMQPSSFFEDYFEYGFNNEDLFSMIDSDL